jgi:hypothetical protein
MRFKQVLPAITIFFAFPAIVAAQARSKFPVSASSKVLGYGPLWAADKKGSVPAPGKYVDLSYLERP